MASRGGFIPQPRQNPTDVSSPLPSDQGKMDEQSAGYMELDGAQKDADCQIVDVQGGVSQQLGCCNEFQPQDGAQEFRCGTCMYVEPGEQGSDSEGMGDMDQMLGAMGGGSENT